MKERTPSTTIDDFFSLPSEIPNSVIEAGLTLLPSLSGRRHRTDRARVRHRVGVAWIAKGEYETAFRSLSEARQIHEDFGDIQGILTNELAFGLIYNLSDQPEWAFETFLLVQNIAKEEGLTEVEEAAICNMGRICNEQNRIEEAMDFLKSAKKLIQSTGNTEHKAAVLHELGRGYLQMGRIETARENLEEAVRFAKEIRTIFGYDYQISLGELYTRAAQYDEAKELLSSTLKFCQSASIRHGEIRSLYHLGDLSAKLGLTDEAIMHWKKCYKLTDSPALPHYRKLSGKGLVESLRQQGFYEEALGYLEDIHQDDHLIQNERLHHIISSYNQSLRFNNLEKEIQTWRRRSKTLERIRDNREEFIQELEIIRDIGKEITASLQSNTIVQVLHNRLPHLLTVDNLSIALYNKDKEILDIKYTIELDRHLDAVEIPIAENQGIRSWVILNDQDLIIHNREEAMKYNETRFQAKDNEYQSESGIFVRLKVEEQIIGLLSVQSLRPNRYQKRQLKIIQALAGFVAIALANSHAHQTLLAANKKIAYLATHDNLTGLSNRMQLMDRLNQELNRCRRYKKALAVLFIDLDGFKQINDTFGHCAGDAVIIEGARRLSSEIRTTDAIGRLAGDEFLVILTDDCTPKNGMKISTNLRESLSKPITFGGKTMQVTASIGMAFYPQDGETPETLVHAADKAMYEAKANGKNLSVLHNSVKKT